MSLIIEKLNKNHLKSDFDCNNLALNNYIRMQAKQDVNRDLSACYVLNEIGEKKVLGFYTLSGGSIAKAEFPEILIKKMPSNYDYLPTILLGRLAVDENSKGKGYGEILLFDAFNKCVNLSKSLGVLSIIVDPIDNNAILFYEKYGFILIPSNNKMFITIKTIKDYF